MKNAEYFIEKLNLEPHPEGGYFKEVYRNDEFIKSDALPSRYLGERNFGTSIYYLLQNDEKSHLHKLKSDELWYYHYGSALQVHLISPTSEYSKIVIGNQIEKGEQLQAIIPHGYWFGACLSMPNSFALVGCAVIPGFDFSDFEMGKREYLLEEFPQHKDIINKLTR